MKNKISISKFLKIVITFSSIIYFVFFISNNILFFKNLYNFNIFEILLILILKFFNIFLLSKLNIFILEYLDVKLTNQKSLYLTVKNSLGNLSMPLKLGTGYKISFLKESFNTKISDYMFWNTFFSLINLIPIIFIFILFSIFVDEDFTQGKEIYYLASFVLIWITFLMFSKINTFKNKLKSFKFFSKSNFYIQILNFLFFLSSCIITFVIASNFSENLKFYSAVSYNSLNVFINLINLTPGNIGIKETILIIFNSIHELSFQVVIITSSVERLLSFIVLFLYHFLFKISKSK